MVKLDTVEEWQRQSSLLLQARPTTTRITTKYNIPNLESAKFQRPKKRKREEEPEEKDGAASAPKVPRAVLTLKTFDPESGVCLKFKTDRAADVGRLFNGLGRLARHMAALPEKTEEPIPQDVSSTATGQGTQVVNASIENTAHADKGQQAPSGGGGKKKKKGKK